MPKTFLVKTCKRRDVAPVTTTEGLDIEAWRISKSSHSHEVECYEGCEQCDAKVVYENNHVQSSGKFIYFSQEVLETLINEYNRTLYSATFIYYLEDILETQGHQYIDIYKSNRILYLAKFITLKAFFKLSDTN